MHLAKVVAGLENQESLHRRRDHDKARVKVIPVGHRMNAWLASLGSELAAHAETFKKYPPKNVGL